jgi:Holliday junction DNA helicase RuvA
MIAYLEGRLLEASEQACVLLTAGGVGYEVSVPRQVLNGLPEQGGQLSLYVSTIVREDALELYGFPSWDERQTFELLLTISRLGPKTGLAILSAYSPDELRRIVAEDEVFALERISGIGKKSAQHIFLELKYKLKPGRSGVGLPVSAPQGSVLRDALTGLGNLGYNEDEMRPTLEAILKEEPDLDVSGALRAALKAIARKKA